jgi:hypothetical protein
MEDNTINSNTDNLINPNTLLDSSIPKQESPKPLNLIKNDIIQRESQKLMTSDGRELLKEE